MHPLHPPTHSLFLALACKRRDGPHCVLPQIPGKKAAPLSELLRAAASPPRPPNPLSPARDSCGNISRAHYKEEQFFNFLAPTNFVIFTLLFGGPRSSRENGISRVAKCARSALTASFSSLAPRRRRRDIYWKVRAMVVYSVVRAKFRSWPGY